MRRIPYGRNFGFLDRILAQQRGETLTAVRSPLYRDKFRVLKQ
jgi:hypothetical protein